MYACGACGGTHFGRSREELSTGRRKARCGRLVYLVITRTYRLREISAADLADVLALSDERDKQLALRLGAWHDGLTAGTSLADAARLRAFADGWDQGIAAGIERGRP